MPKTDRDVRRAPRKNGWTMERTSGSHERWRGPDGRETTVPSVGKDGRDVPTGTLSAIRRQTGIEELR
jgi:predicted RNA binding protein YcfA (HicA-like mRNA interferase family)